MHWSRNRLTKFDLGMVHKWAVAWFINCGMALQCKMTHLASGWESFFTFSFSHPKVLSPGKKKISQIAWNNTLSVLAVKAISAPCKWREYPIHNQHIMLLSKAKLENFKNNHCLNVRLSRCLVLGASLSSLRVILCQHMKDKTKWKPRKISFSFPPPCPPPLLFLLGMFLFVCIKLTHSSP